MRVGIIGLGGIGNSVITSLHHASLLSELEIVGVLVKSSSDKSFYDKTNKSIRSFNTCEELLSQRPDVIAECADHTAVQAYAEDILTAGIKLVCISIGALADEKLYERLKNAAVAGNTSMILPSGAVGGIDALSAARLSGINRVCYTCRKPPKVWRGTPAEDKINLDELKHGECFYRGNARDAALQYPKNSNVAATIALAGIGFEATEVNLIADPDLSQNCHEVEVDAISGSFNISLSGHSLPENPKSSALAAYSVANCLMKLDTAIVI